MSLSSSASLVRSSPAVALQSENTYGMIFSSEGVRAFLTSKAGDTFSSLDIQRTVWLPVKSAQQERGRSGRPRTAKADTS